MSEEWNCYNVARAFASMALAIASAGRVDLEAVKELRGFTTSPMDEGAVERLRYAALIGQVTTIVPNPEPYTLLHVSGSYGSRRTVLGVWMEKKASFYGKPPPELKPSLMVSAKEIGVEDVELPEPEFIAEGTV